MGIIHLRWDPFGAWQAIQPSAAQRWQNLTTLKLSLHNPSTAHMSPEARKIIPSQHLMFLKMLQAYLRSFSPTLHCLKFMWHGTAGPSPILLHREHGMESQQAIRWARLEELWYSNITHQRGTLMALPQLAPGVTKIKAFQAADTQADASASDAWQDITVPNAYTSYGPGGPNDLPVPKKVFDRIHAANDAHAQNRITPIPSRYDRPLSHLLNKLAERPVPRKRLRKIQRLTPPPTRPLPPIPSQDAVVAAQTGLDQREPQQSVSTISVPSLTTTTPKAAAPPNLETPASTSTLHPSIPATLAAASDSTTAPPDPPATAAARIANWRQAMALSTISFADEQASDNRDTIFSETNTDADDLYEGNGRPRPDSEAWPITRFRPPPTRAAPQAPAEVSIHNGRERLWFARDSMESSDTVMPVESRWSESESGIEYSDGDNGGDGEDENADRMSVVSARVEPLRLGGSRGMNTEPPATDETSTLQQPRRPVNNTSSIYSEVGAYGAGAYRPPAR
ncbi:hypothetical protein CLAFUR0_09426 [Fulvia fulva]|nr:hypothetical protein CLAFUR0_09426 [Fulvia fulva]